MIDLRNGELKDILPLEFTRQPQVVAISYAIKQAYQTYVQVMDKILVYAFIDGAPEFALDLLAVELNVRYYNNDYSVEVKRDLIKNALIVAAKDGTNYAVETVILSIWGNGTVDEWYDYGGTPNHFRVTLHDVTSMDAIDRLAENIEAVKRKTARLDAINISVPANEEIGFGEILMERATVFIDSDQPSSDIVFYADELNNALTDENNGLLFSRVDEV